MDDVVICHIKDPGEMGENAQRKTDRVSKAGGIGQ
jgi:hypothetical protein